MPINLITPSPKFLGGPYGGSTKDIQLLTEMAIRDRERINEEIFGIGAENRRNTQQLFNTLLQRNFNNQDYARRRQDALSDYEMKRGDQKSDDLDNFAQQFGFKDFASLEGATGGMLTSDYLQQRDFERLEEETALRDRLKIDSMNRTAGPELEAEIARQRKLAGLEDELKLQSAQRLAGPMTDIDIARQRKLAQAERDEQLETIKRFQPMGLMPTNVKQRDPLASYDSIDPNTLSPQELYEYATPDLQAAMDQINADYAAIATDDAMKFWPGQQNVALGKLAERRAAVMDQMKATAINRPKDPPHIAAIKQRGFSEMQMENGATIIQTDPNVKTQIMDTPYRDPLDNVPSQKLASMWQDHYETLMRRQQDPTYRVGEPTMWQQYQSSLQMRNAVDFMRNSYTSEDGTTYTRNRHGEWEPVRKPTEDMKERFDMLTAFAATNNLVDPETGSIDFQGAAAKWEETFGNSIFDGIGSPSPSRQGGGQGVRAGQSSNTGGRSVKETQERLIALEDQILALRARRDDGREHLATLREENGDPEEIRKTKETLRRVSDEIKSLGREFIQLRQSMAINKPEAPKAGSSLPLPADTQGNVTMFGDG
jgi:hypothetical protein